MYCVICDVTLLFVFLIQLLQIYWTSKVRDQRFTRQFLENIKLLVKWNISIIKAIHFVSFVPMKIETTVSAFNKTRL